MHRCQPDGMNTIIPVAGWPIVVQGIGLESSRTFVRRIFKGPPIDRVQAELSTATLHPIYTISSALVEPALTFLSQMTAVDVWTPASPRRPGLIQLADPCEMAVLVPSNLGLVPNRRWFEPLTRRPGPSKPTHLVPDYEVAYRISLVSSSSLLVI